MVGIEHQQVGALARRQFADGAAEGLRAAGQGLAVEAPADRSVVSFTGQHIAAARREALAVLEPAQLLDGADRDVAVGAEARSEEPTSELQSLLRISYAVFCLNNKKK